MTLFAERFGYGPKPLELDLEAMPKSLRNGLWDILRQHVFDIIGSEGSAAYRPAYNPIFKEFVEKVQFDLFRESLDDLFQSPSDQLNYIKRYFFECEFWEVYNFIEFTMKAHPIFNFCEEEEHFRKKCNGVLVRERAQFRLVHRQFVSVTGNEEIEEIDAAIGNVLTKAVATHISTAARMLSAAEYPDYRNSVKESVSAVEAAVRFVTGKKTSGVSKPLKLVEKEFSFHPALREGFEKIFAFSSDEGGIRHALSDVSNISYSDAKFMLVACSAFANYLITLKSET